jgi:restriction system protein
VPDQPDLPRWNTLFWPTLKAVKALGGSGSIREIESKVAEVIGATEQQQAVLHGQGPGTEINYRIAWCRTYLKGAGYLTNSSRGVWSITDAGREATEADMATVEARYRALHPPRRAARPGRGYDPLTEDPEAEEESAPSWRKALQQCLINLRPDRFEHLAKRLLREAGFKEVEVTGRSGDGGIDGTGIYRPTLVSFPVFFQCKRYSGTVTPSQVRDFRGAMAGRGDQGILITTGTFTTEATKEASRQGAPLVDLIDGEELCSLLERYQLGVKTTLRTVEDIEVVPEFFDQF